MTGHPVGIDGEFGEDWFFGGQTEGIAEQGVGIGSDLLTTLKHPVRIRGGLVDDVYRTKHREPPVENLIRIQWIR